MNLNGCHNRPKLKHTTVVQAGWYSNILNHDHQVYTKQPRMITIGDPMSKDCQYQKLKKDDPKCLGCKHLESENNE
jgi:hypothetical protein